MLVMARPRTEPPLLSGCRGQLSCGCVDPWIRLVVSTTPCLAQRPRAVVSAEQTAGREVTTLEILFRARSVPCLCCVCCARSPGLSALQCLAVSEYRSLALVPSCCVPTCLDRVPFGPKSRRHTHALEPSPPPALTPARPHARTPARSHITRGTYGPLARCHLEPLPGR